MSELMVRIATKLKLPLLTLLRHLVLYYVLMWIVEILLLHKVKLRQKLILFAFIFMDNIALLLDNYSARGILPLVICNYTYCIKIVFFCELSQLEPMLKAGLSKHNFAVEMIWELNHHSYFGESSFLMGSLFCIVIFWHANFLLVHCIAWSFLDMQFSYRFIVLHSNF